MSIRYTSAQQAAVRYGDGDLLLSAAAGSGKTAALTGRITELIRDGRARLSEMLIVTFTRAAATEMRSRIAKRLQEMAAEADGDEERAERITRAISEVPSADISTIHSFLLKVLRPRFPALGLSPDTRIGEQRILDMMRAKAMRETVDDFFGGRVKGADPADFVALADVIGQVRDTATVDKELAWLTAKLTEFGLDERALFAYAEEMERAAGMPLLETPFGRVLADAVREMQRHYRAVFDELRDELAAEPDTWAKYAPSFAEIMDWLDAVEAALDGQDFNRLREALASYHPERLATVRNPSETAASFKAFRAEFKEAAAALCANLKPDDGETAESARDTACLLRSAGEVCRVYFERLSKMKRDAGLLDYSDLETLATRLFVGENGEPTAAAREVGASYRYLFVDEYQDTNEVQDKIFSSLFGDAVRFMVGDVKQSIYRFRGADPAVFTRHRAEWTKVDPAEVESGRADYAAGHSLFLSENFRCAEPVVDFTNAVSETILPGSGTPFDREDRLIHAREEKPGAEPKPVEVVLIEKRRRGRDEEPDENAPGNPEAEYVADRIAAMLARYDDGAERLVRPADIAILLRSPSTSGTDYLEALERRGIPARQQTERPLSAYPSVMLLTCLLNLADNPLRDVTTAGAMRSPVFGFPIGELVTIREAAGDMPLYVGVTAVAAWPDERAADPDGRALREKCRELIRWQERHAAAARSLTADKYLEYLLSDTAFFSLPGIRGKGAERDAVNRFAALARTYEDNAASVIRFGGLSGFLSFLAESADGHDGDKKAAEATDAVSIMSIHASKGLEFPICFVSECAKKRNANDESRTVLFDPVIGLGMYLTDEGGLVRCDTLIRRAIAEKIRRESVDEEMRMLYVALTRARDRLIVTGKTADADEMIAKTVRQREFADAYTHRVIESSYLDWIVGACVAGGRYRTLTTVDADTVTAGEAARAKSAEAIPAADTAEMAARFAFAYPDRFLAGVPSKLTVSRLNPRILDDGESDGMVTESAADAPADGEKTKKPMRRPQFMEGKADATAAERGTATHAFLQFCDFAALGRDGFAAERDRMVEKKFLSAATASLIDGALIERFIRSELYEKILRSPMVKREFRFNAVMDADRFTEDRDLGEKLRAAGTKVTVQGVVDCVFRDPDTGTLTLIDYKTDAILADEWKNQDKAEARLAERHGHQLAYYREICEAMFEEEIPVTAIYSVPLGRTIRIGGDGGERQNRTNRPKPAEK